MFQSSLAPKSERNIPLLLFDNRVFLFQSSLAPKSERNAERHDI